MFLSWQEMVSSRRSDRGTENFAQWNDPMASNEHTTPHVGGHHISRGKGRKQPKRVIVPRGGAQSSNPGAENEESMHGGNGSQVLSDSRGRTSSRSAAMVETTTPPPIFAQPRRIHST